MLDIFFFCASLIVDTHGRYIVMKEHGSTLHVKRSFEDFFTIFLAKGGCNIRIRMIS